ncbi:MAG: hypothetical protein SFY32_05485 [Bacteroidota bacterium]|nr:hypothetical protein [Bacteroidota bacterium]
MIAIVESGTTKTSWLFVDNTGRMFDYKTVGMNPYFQNSEDISNTLSESLIPNLGFTVNVDKIFFYGAGCELPAQKETVKKGIQKVFPNTDVQINHDLLAAARALFGDVAGIACIAGTGANSCYYDGKDVIKNIHSLGLFMGDEGSGGYKGKLLVADYIREAMPNNIRAKFEAFTPDRTKEMMDAVYLKPFPSRYLASFVPFIVQNISDPYIHDLAYRSFENQFDNTVCRYENYKNIQIGFVGSVAHYLKDILLEVAAKKGANVTKIIQAPLDALVNYHKEKGMVK